MRGVCAHFMSALNVNILVYTDNLAPIQVCCPWKDSDTVPSIQGY